MKHVEIYTDGSCRYNPGPGGWGAILVYRGHEREMSGGDASTTNNRMELTSAIEALSALREPCRVTLTSDSKYLTDAINEGWIRGWQKANWRRKSEEIPNADLWRRLVVLLGKHDVTFVWVRGHDGHPYNERCDKMAQAESAKFLGDAGAPDAGSPDAGAAPDGGEASDPDAGAVDGGEAAK